jgi:hypothetical protein
MQVIVLYFPVPEKCRQERVLRIASPHGQAFEDFSNHSHY